MDTSWVIGFAIFVLVVVIVAVLVITILVLANKIGKQANEINAALELSQENTAPLAALKTTIDHATEIVGRAAARSRAVGGLSVMEEVAAADATLWWVMLGLAGVVAVVVVIAADPAGPVRRDDRPEVVQVRDTAEGDHQEHRQHALIAPTG